MNVCKASLPCVGGLNSIAQIPLNIAVDLLASRLSLYSQGYPRSPGGSLQNEKPPQWAVIRQVGRGGLDPPGIVSSSAQNPDPMRRSPRHEHILCHLHKPRLIIISWRSRSYRE